MTNKFLINWAIWIGVMSGIYCGFYVLSPLNQYNIIWMTFVALPIFFNGGAKVEDYVAFLFSIVIGVVWGIVYLFFIGKLGFLGGALATAIGVGGLCVIQCAIHFIPPLCKTPFRVIPAMFGAISMTFSWAFHPGGTGTALTGSPVDDFISLLPVTLTLLGGCTLALICGLGTRFLTPEGNWTMPGKKPAA
jgi:hypothetical protein